MPKINQVTVFGATGFIGRHLVRRLARTGALIRIPTRDPEKALALKPMGDVGQIVPLLCSTRHDGSVSAAIGHSDAVINLTGILYEKASNSFQSVHVEGAARIARLAREQGVKYFTHLSALGADNQSASAYARSKAAGEQAVRTFFPQASIMRPSIVFGPEDRFFNLFATLSCFSPILPLIGGGTTQFQPVYVGDVAEAITETLKSTSLPGGTYELGGPQVYSFRELLELMLTVTKRRRCLINLPWALAKLQARFLEMMPHPLMTRDQIELLKADNILRNPQVKQLSDLGLTPTALEIILPTYLERFKPKA